MPASYFTDLEKKEHKCLKTSSVFILHFSPSLRFTWSQSAVCILPLVHSLHWPLFWRIPTVQNCKSLAFSSNHDFAWQKVVWLGVTVRLLIPQWCNIRKSSVYLLLNMHIIISSWRMLYFQCLIIRFYRFSLILPKRRKITWVHTSCRCLSEISSHVGAFGV